MILMTGTWLSLGLLTYTIYAHSTTLFTECCCHTPLSLSQPLSTRASSLISVSPRHIVQHETHIPIHSAKSISFFCHLHIYTTLSCSITAIVLNCCGENTKSLVVLLVQQQIDRELRNTVKWTRWPCTMSISTKTQFLVPIKSYTNWQLPKSSWAPWACLVRSFIGLYQNWDGPCVLDWSVLRYYSSFPFLLPSDKVLSV